MKKINKMKSVIFAITLGLIFIGNAAYASFPVKSNHELTSKVEQSSGASKKMKSDVKETKIEKVVKSKIKSGGGSDKNIIILLLLWWFLGFLAAHRWYAGKPAGWNILFILTLGGFGIWWLIDLFSMLGGNFGS